MQGRIVTNTQVGFKMFLNVTATVTDWNTNKTECSLVRHGGLLYFICFRQVEYTDPHRFSRNSLVADVGRQPIDGFCRTARRMCRPGVLQFAVWCDSRGTGHGACTVLSITRRRVLRVYTLHTPTGEHEGGVQVCKGCAQGR